jgi:hypothetical protein
MGLDDKPRPQDPNIETVCGSVGVAEIRPGSDRVTLLVYVEHRGDQELHINFAQHDSRITFNGTPVTLGSFISCFSAYRGRINGTFHKRFDRFGECARAEFQTV